MRDKEASENESRKEVKQEAEQRPRGNETSLWQNGKMAKMATVVGIGCVIVGPRTTAN